MSVKFSNRLVPPSSKGFISVDGAFAGAVLKALDLRQRVPPKIFGFAGGVDGGSGRQTFVAIGVPGLVAKGAEFREKIAFFVTAETPDAAVWNDRLDNTRGLKVMLFYKSN